MGQTLHTIFGVHCTLFFYSASLASVLFREALAITTSLFLIAIFYCCGNFRIFLRTPYLQYNSASEAELTNGREKNKFFLKYSRENRKCLEMPRAYVRPR